MKRILSLFVALCVCLPCSAEDDPELQFYEGLDAVRAKYRAQRAEVLKKADRVVVYLLDFDNLIEEEAFGDEEKTVAVAPYEKRARILKSKEVEAKDREALLGALCKAIAEPEHTGGAFCHFPIHGIKIYAGDTLLHEGTFCWVCRNFSFKYPVGSGWLDTGFDLKGLFTDLMPIPEEEMERFHKKYPGAKR